MFGVLQVVKALFIDRITEIDPTHTRTRNRSTAAVFGVVRALYLRGIICARQDVRKD